jgi:hypothetical protein
MAGGYMDSLAGILPGTTNQVDPTSAHLAAGSAGVAVGTGTGRFGLVPIASNISTGLAGLIDDFWDWLKTPFGPLSPLTLGEIVGFTILAWLIWISIFYHIRIAGESI